MIQHVQKGERITAQQYNAVADALGGLPFPSSGIFRNTGGGTLFNGGYSTSPENGVANPYFQLFQVQCFTGQIPKGMEGFQDETSANYFHGYWVDTAAPQRGNQSIYAGGVLLDESDCGPLFVTDPTGEDDGSLKLFRVPKTPMEVWRLSSTSDGFWMPVRRLNPEYIEDFDIYAITFQDITVRGQGGQLSGGEYFQIVGDLGEDLVIRASEVIAAVNAAGGVDAGEVTYIRPVAARRIFTRRQELDDDDDVSPFNANTAIDLGPTQMGFLPDSQSFVRKAGEYRIDVDYVSADSGVGMPYVDSLQLLPYDQVGLAVGPNVMELYNFHRLSSDEMPDVESELSNYDVLVKHKAKHPLQDTVDVENGCSAKLEYFSLSDFLGFKTVDSQISDLLLSSIQEKAEVETETGKVKKYHQLFNFQNPPISDFALSDREFYDVVVRDCNPDHVEQGSIVNYIPLSDLLSAQAAPCDVALSAAMKASLFCYDYETEYDAHGDEQLKLTRWAWHIWLGKGASYGGGYAYGDACTVGGNPVMFECSNGAPTRNWNGDMIWWNDGIAVGTFTVQAGNSLPAHDLWLSYHFDAANSIVRGSFGGVQPQPDPDDWSTYGLLEPGKFVAASRSYTPPTRLADVETYMEVPLDKIGYGTFGHENEGYPLLDKYWNDDYLTARSLDWTRRNSQNSVKDLYVAELYEFDKLSSTQPAMFDDVVIRRKNDTNSVAEVKYVPISSFFGGVQVDTAATNGDQCSIDKKVDQQTSGTYLQLFNFDQTDHENNTLAVNLVYGQSRYAHFFGDGTYPDPYSHFIVRNSYTNNQVEYDALEIYAPSIYASDIQDLSQTISGWGFVCSCDCQGLSTMIAELSNELSDRWKCGGTYDDNCYGQSIGDDSQNPQIDLNNGQLLYSNELDPTLDWHNGYLNWNSGELRLDWSGCKAYDTAQGESIGWDSRQLKDSGGMPTVEWESKRLNGLSGVAVDWQNHMLMPTGGSPTVEWGNCVLDDLNTNQSLDWGNRQLLGDWSCPYGDFSIGDGFVLKIGNTTITEPQLQYLLTLSAAVDAGNFQLMSRSGNPTVKFADRQLLGNWTSKNGSVTIDGTSTFKIGNTSLSEAQLTALLALIS